MRSRIITIVLLHINNGVLTIHPRNPSMSLVPGAQTECPPNNLPRERKRTVLNDNDSVVNGKDTVVNGKDIVVNGKDIVVNGKT